jgi:putative transposase
VIDGWVDEYHQRVHSELGCSPAAMAERHTTHVVRIDERALDLFLMPVAGSGTRTVTSRASAGQRGWFRAPELAAVIGQQVRCRQDEADLGALHVFALDGAFICRALDHTLLGINRAELAAKARDRETTIKPFQQACARPSVKGLVRQAVDAIYRDRENAAVDAGRQRHAPAAARGDGQHAGDRVGICGRAGHHRAGHARAAARAAFDDERPVVRMDTPKQRYSAWVRLQARVVAGEQLAERDVAWIRSYEGSTEFAALALAA